MKKKSLTISTGKKSGLFQRLSQGVWLPLLLKVIGVTIGVFCLAMLGKESEVYDEGGSLRLLTSATGQLQELHQLDAVHLGNQLLAGASSESLASRQDPIPEQSQGLTKMEDTPEKCVCPCNSEHIQVPASAFLADGRLILNLATVDELIKLPGVGPSRAAAIVALRKRLKGFRKVNDLLRVRGIGWKSLAKLKPKIVLDRPKKGI